MSTNIPRHTIDLRLVMTMCVLLIAVALCSLLSTDLHSTYRAAVPPHNNSKPHILPKHTHIAAKPATPKQRPTPSPKPSVTPDAYLPAPADGMVPVITSVPTKQPVVFLTIDDGAHKTPDELQTMKDNHLVASLFLARMFILDNPLFFTDFTKEGNLIENHSLDHYITPAAIESYDLQKQQICGMADYEQQTYGRRPIFFRPPGGSYSVAMRKAAYDCGMKAIVTWIAKANGGSMQYQIGDHLRPGDVVLMHFRPEFQQDMRAFLDAMNSQHLHTELLENWLAPQ